MITLANFFNRMDWQGEVVSIANRAPKWFVGKQYKELAPGNIVWKFRNCDITEEQYTNKYKLQLSKLNVQKIGEELEGKTLLCWEATGNFCHRMLVAEWLTQAGFEVALF